MIKNLKYKPILSWFLVVAMVVTPGGVFVNIDTAHADQVAEYNPQGLSPTGWTITDEYNENILTNLTDNNPGTYSTVSSNPSTGTAGFVINLGSPTVVDRVYLAGPTTGEGQSTSDGSPAIWSDDVSTPPPGLIRVYVGNTSNPTAQVAESMLPYDAGSPVDTEADLRFQPVVGQYIRVEVQTANINWWNYWAGWSKTLTLPATLPWNVGEVEVHGYAGQSSITPKDAVILPANAAQPLTVAANDLSYYLGKLTGNPVPIITDAQESSYPGTIYRVEDLQSLAPNYATMIANEKSGLLPTDISVVAQGREVQFSGWPYRNVLKSVWTFLAAQGIHWVYPTPHGDYIPAIGSVNLSMLPLTASSIALPNTTSPKSVYANWDAGSFQPFAVWINQPLRQGFLNIWRNGWNISWNNPWQVLGGSEIPTPIPTSSTLSSTLPNDYSTEFSGYPHNFNGVVPLDVLNANPTWCGYDASSGTRICNPNSITFDMTNPDLINWVSNKMTAVAAYAPIDTSGTFGTSRIWYGLLPMDSTEWDEGPNSLQANSSSASSVVPILDPIPWVSGTGLSQSGAYYNFVNQVATQAKQQNPSNPPLVGALAYSDVFLPPPSWEVPTLSSNVKVEICQYGSPNLPIASAPNAAFKQALDQWHSLASASGALLGNYDYTLLLTDFWQPAPQLPVPAVAGIVDRAEYLAKMGALEGGSQGNASSMPYNPWDFYAYARVRQNTTLTASQIENEFFTSYFKEAAVPMLAYYQTMENWQVQNSADMHDIGYADSIMPGTFPNQVLYTMYGYLQEAQGAAQSWIVKKRVADMMTGFNWILTKRNLQVANLNNTSNYQAVGQNNQPVTLGLQNGVITMLYINPEGNGGYIQPGSGPDMGSFCTGSINGYGVASSSCPNAFWSLLGGNAYLPLYFAQGGTYQITIQASGAAYDSTWANPPQMKVFIGPQSFPFSVSTTGKQNYVITANIPSGFGVQDLWVSSPNHNAVTISNVSVTRTGAAQINYGDVINSGNVTIYDAELTAQYAIGLPVSNFNTAAAEVDGTNTVNIYDAFLIAEYAVGVINKFPVQQ